MRIKDWPGMANGEGWSRSEKSGARADEVMPEDVERELMRIIGNPAVDLGNPKFSIPSMWRGAVFDVEARNGEVLLSMSTEQAALWRSASGR